MKDQLDQLNQELEELFKARNREYTKAVTLLNELKEEISKLNKLDPMKAKIAATLAAERERMLLKLLKEKHLHPSNADKPKLSLKFKRKNPRR